MNTAQKHLNLLPSYFKRIGISLIIASILVLIAFKIEVFEGSKETWKHVSISLILLGLSIIALTKNKIEDEFTMLLRLKALGAAFIFGLAYVLISPILNLIFGDDVNEYPSSLSFMMSMLLFYFMLFFLMKRNQG